MSGSDGEEQAHSFQPEAGSCAEKARQPIPVSPYDDLRVEFHIEENLYEGKIRRVEPEKGEKLPEWATPVFVVDQDAKRCLGGLCALTVW